MEQYRSNENVTIMSEKIREYGKVALFAGTLYAASPEGARAWENTPTVSPETIGAVLEQIDFPSLDTVPATVTHFVPSTIPEGPKYVVHIRQVHKSMNTAPADLDNDAITRIVSPQQDIQSLITAVTEYRPYTTFYVEGFGQENNNTLVAEKRAFEQFRQVLAAEIADYKMTGDFDVNKFFDFLNQRINNGQTLTPYQYMQYAALTIDTFAQSAVAMPEALENRMQEKILIPDASPEEVLLVTYGALELSYLHDEVKDLRGCEDIQLMSTISLDGSVSSEDVRRINQDRETAAVACITEQLIVQDSPYAVFVMGGAHNLSDEIAQFAGGVGYIVITPDSYPEDARDYEIP